LHAVSSALSTGSERRFARLREERLESCKRRKLFLPMRPRP
jgi:hypothetical protein